MSNRIKVRGLVFTNNKGQWKTTHFDYNTFIMGKVGLWHILTTDPVGEVVVSKYVDGDFQSALSLASLDTWGFYPLSKVALDIKRDWVKVNYGAVPYLDAMRTMMTPDMNYGYDTGAEIVLRFLSNASSWRGDLARQLKPILKGWVTK